MAKWMDELTTVEKDSIEKIPYHKDYDSWTLYRDETPLCSGVWVNARMDGSYKYKFFNPSFNKYVIRTVMPNGEFEDEVEGHETHQEEQFDYNVM